MGRGQSRASREIRYSKGLKVEVSKRASAELDSAVAFLRQRNPQAADRVHAAIESALDSLSLFHERGRPGAIKGTRELVVRATPYVLVYSVEDAAVLIIRIRHVSQDPSPQP